MIEILKNISAGKRWREIQAYTRCSFLKMVMWNN